jgi:uncharacterized protein YkwD
MKVKLKLAVLTSALLLCSGATASGEYASFKTRILEAHNSARGAFGSPDLVWDEALQTNAQAWADHLAQTGSFAHARQSEDGENLWMGSASAYQLEEMVGAWIAEKQYFKHGIFPNVSTTQKWSDVGHYTQIVWKTTTKVGCALATGGGNDILVCRYGPPGNWEDVAI